MGFQHSLSGLVPRSSLTPKRRFLALFLPFWPTEYLKRHDPDLTAPLALYHKVKGGLRLAAIDQEGIRQGLVVGQTLADARAMLPNLMVRKYEPDLLAAAFADFADWHSNASPLVAIMTDRSAFGDLVLDITGIAHLFDGEAAMLRTLLTRLRKLGYTVAGAVASTIGGAWAVSHFARSQVIPPQDLSDVLDALPMAALRLDDLSLATLTQMGLRTIGQLRARPRKSLQARFGAVLTLRLDQAYGEVEERLNPHLPAIEYFAERRFPDPIGLMDDVLATTHDLAVALSCQLEAHGLGAQTFHLFLYRVDHKVMRLSLNAARLTRDPAHISALFRHRAQRLEGEYDAGFGIDMVRLAASSLDRLDANQLGAFSADSGVEALDQLTDRLSSRLGHLAVLRTELVASHIPERAARLVPVLAGRPAESAANPGRLRPLRLLPMPEAVSINAEVPDGLPASMIWRHQPYRLVKAAGPERLGAEWWRTGERLKLVEPPPPEPDKPTPYLPALNLFDPDAGTRDYYMVEDEEGRRFWIYRQGMYGGPVHPCWYLHGIFP